MTYRPPTMPGVEVRMVDRGDKRIPAQTIVCAECNRSNSLVSSKLSGALPAEACARVWTNRGWYVDAKKGKHLCPVCLRAHEEKASRKRLAAQIKEQTVTVRPAPEAATPVKGNGAEQPTPGPSRAPQPAAQMDTVTRRLIFRAIDEVYDDTASRYRRDTGKPNTDEAIAKDLGVPVEWVAQVREDNFGPSGETADMQEILHELAILKEELGKLKMSLPELYATLKKIGDEAGAKMEEVSKQVKALEEHLHKHLPVIDSYVGKVNSVETRISELTAKINP